MVDVKITLTCLNESNLPKLAFPNFLAHPVTLKRSHNELRTKSMLLLVGWDLKFFATTHFTHHFLSQGLFENPSERDSSYDKKK